jgi:hypothetical protein
MGDFHDFRAEDGAGEAGRGVDVVDGIRVRPRQVFVGQGTTRGATSSRIVEATTWTI